MKLVTFNIRCEWTDDGINSFPHRAGGIALAIREEKPDVICFQECTDRIFSLLQVLLPEYYILFNQRNADRKGEGLAAAIRKDTAQLLGLEVFWLSPTPYLPGSRYAEQSPYPRICQCLTLRCQDRVFRAYNVHLDHKSDQARCLGMEATLRRVKEDLNKAPLPFFVLGDFNAQPQSTPVAYCRNNPFVNLTDLTDAFDHTFHRYGKLPAPHKIDYIFADPTTAQCPHTVSLWTQETDGIYLSDHYPVCALTQL